MRFIRAALVAAALCTGPLAAQASPPAPGRSARDWLSANKGSPDFAPRLLKAAAEEDDLGKAILLIADYLPSLKSGADRVAAARLAASYAEAVGLAREAADWYGKALAEPSGAADRLLVYRYAVCELKAGEAALAFAASERVAKDPAADPRVARKARLLTVWALAALGRREDAVALARSALSEGPGAELAPAFAYAAAYLDEGPPSAEPPSGGGADHPDAILLAARTGSGSKRTGVSALDEPVLYLSGIGSDGTALPSPAPAASSGARDGGVARDGGDAPSPPPASPDRPAVSENPTPRVAGFRQAGAFSVRANADAMAVRLEAAGFKAEIKERASAAGGKLYFVVVPFGDDGKPSTVDLKKAGFVTVPYPY